MDLYIVNALSPFHTAVGAAFNTFTAFQDISPVDIPVIKGNTLRKGSKIEVEAEGEFSNTGTPNLTLGVYYGAVGVSWQSAATLTVTAATAWPWHLRWRGIVTALGATGSMTGQGIMDLGTALTTNSPSNFPATAAARVVAIDTTVDKAIGIGAAWSASSASNTLKVNNMSVLILN